MLRTRIGDAMTDSHIRNLASGPLASGGRGRDVKPDVFGGSNNGRVINTMSSGAGFRLSAEAHGTRPLPARMPAGAEAAGSPLASAD